MFELSVSHWFLPVFGAVCTGTIALLLFWFTAAKGVEGLPTTAWQPWLGSLRDFTKHYSHHYDWLLSYAEKYKGEWYWSLPGVECRLQLYNPKSLEHVLKKNFYAYQKSKHFHDCIQEIIGEGIFNVDGESWRRQRKVASHMFSMKALREHMFPVFQEKMKVIEQVLNKFAESGESFDLQRVFFNATLDSIAKIAFGQDLKCLEMDKTPAFSLAFDNAQQHVSDRLKDPFWRVKKFFRTHEEREFEKNIRLLNHFTSQIITSQREKMAKGGDDSDWEHKHDLLAMFMLEAKEKGVELDDAYLRDMIMNFLIAGRDTTACALTWCFYEMFRSDQREEVRAGMLDEVCALDTDSIEYADVSKLDYCNAFFMESLRLHPPVPTDNKICIKDDVLPNGTKVPAGTNIGYSPFTIGRCEEIWPQALQFRPERWLDGKKHDQWVFPQFNAGPRLCLGKHVAILEAKTFMAGILRKFDFSLCDEKSVHYKVSLTMPVQGGLHVTARHRSSPVTSKPSPPRPLEREYSSSFP